MNKPREEQLAHRINEMVKHTGISSSEKLVLVYLATTSKSIPWDQILLIARDIGLSTKTVQSALDRLLYLNLVKDNGPKGFEVC